MTVAELTEDVVRVELPDGTLVERHALALRDGCPCAECRHPVSGQRLFESSRVLPNARIAGVAVSEEGRLVVDWADGHRSSFAAEWFDPDEERLLQPWDASLEGALPWHAWADVVAEPSARAAWLRDAARLGFSLLHGVPVEEGEVETVAALFGAVRETNYGRHFDVSVSVDARNLADTALPLSPHTDNPYREPTPTLQLLHCLVSDVDGGDTVLVDGFAVVERLRHRSPELLGLLARRPIRFAYRDESAELWTDVPVVTLDAAARPLALHLNNRSKGVPQGDPGDVAAWYEAYLALLGLVESPEQQVVFKLAPGDLVLFDNLRVLHGRTGFASTGARRLQGCYADRDGLLSTLAVLERG
ncbi:MAG: TauD/TfdA family dioxygenase [Actinobacteria bacterium]|nr:TauD/TfdA family dioxygenase [Actinomycetota bacterium]